MSNPRRKLRQQSHLQWHEKIKYLGVNLTKEVKDLYTENYKTLLKETKEDTDKWKDIMCLYIGRLNIAKMSPLPKAIYRVDTISFKIPIFFQK